MEATFIIVREDLQVDRVTIVAEGVLIGRLPICELLLNHPSVSRLHAGISYVDGNYYLRNLRPGNPIMVKARSSKSMKPWPMVTWWVLGRLR